MAVQTRTPAAPPGQTRTPAAPPGQTRTPAAPPGQTRTPALLARSAFAAFATALIMVMMMLGGCRRPPPPRVVEAGGVRVDLDTSPAPMLTGGDLTVFASEADDPGLIDGIASLRVGDGHARGPIGVAVVLGAMPLRFRGVEQRVVDGVASVVRPLRDLDGELTITLDPSSRAVVYALNARRVETVAPVRFRVAVSRAGTEVAFADGAPFAPHADFPPTLSPYFAVGGATPLVIASPSGLEVRGEDSWVVATTPMLVATYGTIDARVVVGVASSMREALALGAQLADRPARKGATIAVEPRNAANGAPIAARILVEAEPREKPYAPLILDPSREAEQGALLVDAITARTLLEVPAGRYVLRATHGIGWSIARRELTVEEGEAVRVALDVREETPQQGWIGCDLHVHARPSFDAKPVSYEDRVRSLVAVGVDCAAATEHDHVGDHGPTAHALGVDPIYHAIRGVELTTGFPQFGHFNVYPWPDGARIPQTHETTPDALFQAVHALPGPFVFQLNHPRMRTSDGISIGYLDIADVDRSGQARGAYAYRRDYDAIEVFNGYQLGQPDKVLAMIDEWVRMLDRGELHVATGSSDSHSITFPWAGFPRSMVQVGTAWAHSGRPNPAIVEAIKRGRVMVTSGPVVRLTVGGASLGDEAKGVGSTAHLEVSLTHWLTAPKAHLRLGLETLPVALHEDAKQRGTWRAEVPLHAVDRKRALVAVAEASLVADVKGITGLTRALAFTNPIWIVP